MHGLRSFFRRNDLFCAAEDRTRDVDSIYGAQTQLASLIHRKLKESPTGWYRACIQTKEGFVEFDLCFQMKTGWFWQNLKLH